MPSFLKPILQFYQPELPNPEKMEFRKTSVVLVSKLFLNTSLFDDQVLVLLLILLLTRLSIFIKPYYYCSNEIILMFIINFKGIMKSLTSYRDEENLPQKSFSEKVILISNSSIYLKLIVAFSKFHFSAKLFNTCRKPFWKLFYTAWDEAQVVQGRIFEMAKLLRHLNTQPELVPERKTAG